MPSPILGSLSSLTDGGSIQASSSASARSGDVVVGGLNVNAAPGSNQTLIIGIAAVLVLGFLIVTFR